jgi:F-type H+-transporting ATPase subunit b
LERLMAETSAHTEVPAGGKEMFPPFQKETFPSQLFWLAITFIALYVVMARIALPQIGAIFQARRDRIGGDLAQAQELKSESESALAAYEKALAEARERAQKIADDTSHRLHAEAEERRKALESELNAKLAEAERAIAATKSAAMANVRGIAADAAAAIVERLIGAAPADAAVKSAVDAALKG